MSINGTMPVSVSPAQPPSLGLRLAQFAGDRAQAQGEFYIGIRSLPALADHGFRDMVVLPGACYIEMALCLERELGTPAVGTITNATFQRPIILVADDRLIKVEMRRLDAVRCEYLFYEGGGAGAAALQHAARLEIDRRAVVPEPGAALAIDAFQAQAQPASAGAEFYRVLGQNGNQYGPSFQAVTAIWHAGAECLAQLAGPRRGNRSAALALPPNLLDAMTQLVAGCVSHQGKTFILRSIDKLEIFDRDFPETLWGHATLSGLSNAGPGSGSVRLSDDLGKCYLQLSGVGFSLLDGAAEGPTTSPACVIAANFTAEPIADSLNFWQDYVGHKSRLEFAPYNQIFQQLLDRGSALWRNRDGANVFLLRLEEWAAAGARSHLEFDRERSERYLGSRSRRVLPNGMEIAQLNPYETDYLYHEIFTDRCYMKHGIFLPDGATVIDIGANIGMFSLFVLSQCDQPTIYAYEPAPAVYDLLQANGAAYGADFHSFNLGVSDRPKTATFTFYEKSSVFSGFHPDGVEDRQAIEAVVRNMLKRQSLGDASIDAYVEELTADRLRAQSHPCRLTSVSQIIRDNRIEKIDLLKIDAEKSELDIINGIAEEDWPKIQQIVMEVHDRSEAAIRRIEAILAGKGFHCAVEQEALLEEGGLFNLFATRAGSAAQEQVLRGVSGDPAATLMRNMEDFCAALGAFANQSSTPVVLLICPRTPAMNSALSLALDAGEAALSARLEALPNIHIVSAASILERYPVRDYYDALSHAAGHVPYTTAGYAAIGSAVARALFSLKREPFKVIALDCDNTLWRGVCGEDGYQGIAISEPYRALQQFMVEQAQAGMLLCLCSKNNERDVLEVFDRRGDMALKREHLVGWRINWNRKSDNLQALARELNLGLDSFIFIDDNPIECAEVRSHCPSVLTLQLPQDSAAIPAFLRHVWAFDRSGSVTEEDRKRTQLYRENAQRQQYLSQAISLHEFIQGLELRVEIAPMGDDQLSRVSQQTLRTNQFNFTTIRRTEKEIKDFLANRAADCQVVRVVDRFGDYGLVGVLLYESLDDRLRVDTFLLSCRVLGRGVEHAIAAWLGQRAMEAAKALVEFVYLETDKNAPALEFITSIGASYRQADGRCWLFPAEFLAQLEYAPDEHAPLLLDDAASDETRTAAGRPAPVPAGQGERLQRVADELNSIEKLTMAIEQFRLKQHAATVIEDAVPASATETTLRSIWKRVLGRPHIGLQENFFEVGGSSLRAVQVIAEIKKELQRTLSIVNLFEAPTLAALAAKLAAPANDADSEGAMSEAARRGQQRRLMPTRPRAG